MHYTPSDQAASGQKEGVVHRSISLVKTRFSLLSTVGALSLGGCASVWVPDQAIDTDEVPVAFFLDDDGDGWGTGPGAMMIGGDEASGFTARNDRDCDDTNPSNTGQVGATCPTDLGADVEPLVFGTTSEFVVVRGASEPVTAEFAARACGPNGWGGGLAAFDSTDEVAQIAAAVSASADWVGWIDAVVTAGADTPSPDDDTWGWDQSSAIPGTLDLSAIGFCDASPAAPKDGAQRHLALLRDGSGVCLGLPEGEVDGETRTLTEAQFVCERPVPNQEDYVLYHTASDG